MGYISLPIGIDPDDLAAEALDTLTQNIPGYIPRDGHLETWMILILSQMNAVTRDVARTVGDDIFRYFGRSLVGVQPIEAEYAEVKSTWVMTDPSGYTVDAGTLVGIRLTGDTLYAFEVMETFTVDPGDTTRWNVVLRSREPGEASNGLGGLGVEAEMIDALGFVQSVTLDGATEGGLNAESDRAFLTRLREEFRLLAPRPIVAGDFAVFARRVPGVHRAVDIPNYDPGTDTYDNERMVTVAVVGSDGQPVGPAVTAEVEAYLDAQREVNFVVHVIDPTYTVVDVDFTITIRPEANPAAVLEAVGDALAEFLDPAVWGGGDEDPPTWHRDDTVVRLLELSHVIYRVIGVDDVLALSINGGTADVVLDGIAPLPQPGVITGTLA
jgi:hypothetical protein